MYIKIDTTSANTKPIMLADTVLNNFIYITTSSRPEHNYFIKEADYYQ